MPPAECALTMDTMHAALHVEFNFPICNRQESSEGLKTAQLHVVC